MKVKPNRRIRRLVVTALLAAAITIMTAYVLHIPLAGGGYIHLGDMLLYVAACVLPAPYAIGAAVIGAGLADLLTAPIWVVPTVIIKSLAVLPFTSKGERFLVKRNVTAVFLAGIVSAVAYALAAWILLGTREAMLPQFIGTLVQAIGNGAAFFVLAGALDKAKLKDKLTVK